MPEIQSHRFCPSRQERGGFWMIWRAGVARFRAGVQAAISVQSPDSGSIAGFGFNLDPAIEIVLTELKE